MAFTYGGDPANSDLEMVRFLVGDTNSDWQLLQDAEVNAILADFTNVYVAASEACQAIIAKLSRDADFKNVGALAVNASQRAEAYRKLARELKNKALTSSGSTAGAIAIGGFSKDEADDLRNDSDNIGPSFSLGQFDHPGSGFSYGGPNDFNTTDDDI